MLTLTPAVQSYDWGLVGSQSLVARLIHAADPSFEIDESKPYAELWLGTHPSAPTKIASDQSLLDLLRSDPVRYLGNSIISRYHHHHHHHQQQPSPDLPFLLKVLSIGKALSIQIHPDKQLASQLHATKSDIYKDDNHKPEMAIALTSFKGFLGFRPTDQIKYWIENVPELSQLILSVIHQLPLSTLPDQEYIKIIFSAVMKADPKLIAQLSQNMIERFENYQEESTHQEIELVNQLHHQFPNDVGLFCVFLLNIVELEPGQAVFLSAGLIHAYISGDIIECMASSDNVIRAGLTPKLRDVPTLLSAVSFQVSQPQSLTLPSKQISTSHLVYQPPINDFCVDVFTSNEIDTDGCAISQVDSPAICIVTQAARNATIDNHPITLGQAMMFLPGQTATLKGQATIYRAYCPAA